MANYPIPQTVEEMTAAARGNLEKFECLAMIARKHLNLETLETRNGDSADFHELAVWDIKAALAAAYEAGKREPPKGPAEWILRQPDGTQSRVTVEKVIARAVVNVPEQKVRTWPLDAFLPDTTE